MTKKGKKKATVQVDAEMRHKEEQREEEKPKGGPPVKLVISKGLDGLDEELEQLLPLFEQLQLVSTELADPELDMLTFAHTAHYFGVLTVEVDQEAEKAAADKERKEREEEDLGIKYPDDERTEQASTTGTGSKPNVKFEEWKEAMKSEEEDWQRSIAAAVKRKNTLENYINDSELEGKIEVEKPEQIPGPPEHTWGSNAPAQSEDRYWRDNHIPDNWGVSNAQQDSSWDNPSSNVGQSNQAYTSFRPAPDRSTWRYRAEWDDYGPPGRDVAGFVFLMSSQQQNDYLRDGELRIGIILAEKHRNKGYGRQAVQDTLNIAFQDKQCNRVQAILIDSPNKDRALGLFMKSGMGHEGVRRRGFRSPYDFEFKDVTYLGLLATDYLVRTYSCFGNAAPAAQASYYPGAAPKSLWDELFARHQREREELLRWEEKQERQQLKRTSSMETIRQATAGVDSEADVESASERSVTPSIKGEEEDVDMYVESYSHRYASSVASERSWTGTGSGKTTWAPLASRAKVEPLSPKKRRRLSGKDEERANVEKAILDDLLGPSKRTGPFIMPVQSGVTASITEWRAQTENAGAPGESFAAGSSSGEPGPSQVNAAQNEGAHRAAYSAFSDDSDVESEVSDGYATSTSSAWDIVETGSTSGSSSLVDVDYDALDIYDDSDEPHAL